MKTELDLSDEHLIMVVTFMKRHQSRKWKKKQFLLRKQHRHAFKQLSKASHRLVKAAKVCGKSIAKLGEGFKNNSWFGTNSDKEEGTDDENKM